MRTLLCSSVVFLLIGAAALLMPLSARAQLGIVSGAPAGFETLDAPRQTVVTIYYGGDVLGSFPAHARPGFIRFDDPAAILTHVPSAQKTDVLRASLGTDMPTHADSLCRAGRTEDCGTISPDIVGVIYDDNRLTVELFINRAYLSVTNTGVPRYLPLPPRQLTSVYNFSGAIDGGAQQTNNFVLGNTAIVSFGEAKITTQTTVDNRGLRFDQMAGTVERNGWDSTGGLFRSRSMQLLTSRDIGGFSVSTSQHTLTDQNKSEGNDVIVYLPRRAYVSIYREGRLYSAAAYEAGNQKIDTSELPNGAYTITLKIEEADGTKREEQRFFVKTGTLPPPGMTSWYAQGGIIRKPSSEDDTIPQFTKNPILRAGAVRRVTDDVGVTVGLVGLQDRAGVETGLVWMAPHGQVTATTLVTTKGDAGVQAGGIMTYSKFTAAIDARRTWFTDTPLPGFGDQPKGNAQITATAGYALSGSTNIGFKASYASTTGMPLSTSVGPYAQWRIWQEGESSLEFNADAARTSGENQGDMMLRFTRRFGKYGVTGGAGVESSGHAISPSANGRVWRDDTNASGGLITGANISGDDRARVISADADYRNGFGHVRGSVQDSIGSMGGGISYVGNFDTAAAQAGTALHLGGSQVDQSALMVDIDGDASAAMAIFVNGMPAASVDVGGRQVLYLAPFHTYDIHVAPKVQGLFDYDSNDRRIAPWPGNVVHLHWTVSSFHIVAGRITRPDGAPLAGALLRGNHDGVVTDDQGFVQAQVSKTDAMEFDMAGGGACRVELPQMEAHNGAMLYTKPLTCAPFN